MKQLKKDLQAVSKTLRQLTLKIEAKELHNKHPLHGFL